MVSAIWKASILSTKLILMISRSHSLWSAFPVRHCHFHEEGDSRSTDLILSVRIWLTFTVMSNVHCNQLDLSTFPVRSLSPLYNIYFKYSSLNISKCLLTSVCRFLQSLWCGLHWLQWISSGAALLWFYWLQWMYRADASTDYSEYKSISDWILLYWICIAEDRACFLLITVNSRRRHSILTRKINGSLITVKLRAINHQYVRFAFSCADYS